jgi:hypothetical protein
MEDYPMEQNSDLHGQLELLMRIQAEKIAHQQRLIDTFRSLFGRLQVFCEHAYFVFDAHPQVHWVRSDSVIEMLAATEGLIDYAEEKGTTKKSPSVLREKRAARDA